MNLMMRNVFKIMLAGLVALPAGCSTGEKVSAVEPQNVAVITQPRPEVGTNLTPRERAVLKFFINQGIKDRMALSVLMGNIKQESMFHPNICEGGARINYDQCHSGGYGLIQWTTSGRYMGLGQHASLTGGDPSTLPTQLQYLVTEREWKSVETRFRTPGKSMSYYMDAAFVWLGWGIHGARTDYAPVSYTHLTLPTTEAV